MSERKRIDELLDVIGGLVAEECLVYCDTDHARYDSHGVTSYAIALRTLAKYGVLELIEHRGRYVVAIDHWGKQ